MVGIVGFRITLRQIRDVKTATEAAEGAIAGLKIRFSHFDVIQESATAEFALSSLRKAAIIGDLDNITEDHDKLAVSLVNLRERFSSQDTTLSQQLNVAIDIIESLPRLLQDNTNSESIKRDKYLNSLRAVHAVIMKIKFYIHQEQ